MTSQAQWSDLVSGDRARAVAAANALLPAWVSLVVVVLIAWQLARIAWMLVPGTDAGSPVTVPAGQLAVSATDSGNADFRAIADAHLFGEADADDAPPAPVATATDAPETRINLTLRGTHTSNDPSKAAAMIYNGSEEKLYAIGDPITSGARLHAVEYEQVILNENGQLTSLKLPKEFSAQPVATRRTNATTRQATPAAQSIQEVVAQNVSSLSDVIRPAPYRQGDQQVGYRLYPGRNRQQFQALGLRPGDLLLEVDGQSLTDPTQAMQVFQSLGSAEQVSVTLERDGSPVTLTLSTDQLDLNKEQTQ